MYLEASKYVFVSAPLYIYIYSSTLVDLAYWWRLAGRFFVRLFYRYYFLYPTSTHTYVLNTLWYCYVRVFFFFYVLSTLWFCYVCLCFFVCFLRQFFPWAQFQCSGAYYYRALVTTSSKYNERRTAPPSLSSPPSSIFIFFFPLARESETRARGKVRVWCVFSGGRATFLLFWFDLFFGKGVYFRRSSS